MMVSLKNCRMMIASGIAATLLASSAAAGELPINLTKPGGWDVFSKVHSGQISDRGLVQKVQQQQAQQQRVQLRIINTLPTPVDYYVVHPTTGQTQRVSSLQPGGIADLGSQPGLGWIFVQNQQQIQSYQTRNEVFQELRIAATGQQQPPRLANQFQPPANSQSAQQQQSQPQQTGQQPVGQQQGQTQQGQLRQQGQQPLGQRPVGQQQGQLQQGQIQQGQLPQQGQQPLGQRPLGQQQGQFQQRQIQQGQLPQQGQQPLGQRPLGQQQGQLQQGQLPQQGQQRLGQRPIGQQQGQIQQGQQPLGQRPFGQQQGQFQRPGYRPLGQQPAGQQPAGQQPLGQPQGVAEPVGLYDSSLTLEDCMVSYFLAGSSEAQICRYLGRLANTDPGAYQNYLANIQVRNNQSGGVQGQQQQGFGNSNQGFGNAVGRFPAAASWGGIVRSQPSLQSERLDSLSEGEVITLLADTGVEMNGYNWFQIQFRNGQTGYQWGGIICGQTQPIRGTFEICN